MSMRMPRKKGAGIVRRHLPEIEKELREGVTLRDIHSAMQENYGLGLSFNGFRNALYRARNECAKGNLPATEQAEVPPAAEKREVLPAKEAREDTPAQDVEKAEARKIYQTSATPNMAEVFKWTNRSTMEELEEFAEGTEAQALFTGNDRASSSVRFVLSNKLAPHLIMPAGDFSLTDWLEDDSSKTLFITWTEATRAALQPMISCWVDTIVQIVLGRRSHQGADVWMWLDELESLGHLPTLGAGLTRGRKKGLRIVSGYQSYSQIVDVYGENLAETMLTNHRSNIVFAVGRQGKATADRMSNALGEHEVMRERPEKSYRWGEWATRSNRREVQRERVVMPSEIMALDDLHGYVSFPGSLPVANFKVEPINFKRSKPVPAIVPVSEMRQFGDVNA